MNGRKNYDAIGIQGDGISAFLICCLCFLAGSLCATAGPHAERAAEALSGQLLAYREQALSQAGLELHPLRLFADHGAFLLVSFLAGFSLTGVVLVPVLSFLRGFLLTLVSAVFLRVFGADCLAALMLLVGVGAVFTVPCFFLISVNAFLASGAAFRAVMLRGGGPPVYGRSYFLRFLSCLFVALLAAFLKKALLQHFLFTAFSM